MLASVPVFDGPAIINRIFSGDQAAEGELIARFQTSVRAYVSSRTSQREWIEDVTQETMLAAIVALREGRLREAGHLGGFVLGIARNQLSDAIRDQVRRKTDAFPLGFDCPMPRREQNPDLIETAHREIQALEPTDRRILWMSLIDGFKAAEIAPVMGMSAELVRQRKSRALKKMVERLQPLTRALRGAARLQLGARLPRRTQRSRGNL